MILKWLRIWSYAIGWGKFVRVIVVLAFILSVSGCISDGDGHQELFYLVIVIIVTIVIAGVTIAITPIANYVKRSRERQMKQRQKYAAEVKQAYNDGLRQCDNVYLITKLQPIYKAIILQENIWNALDTVSIKLQKFNDILIEKPDAEAENTYIKYREKYNELQNLAQSNIVSLEKIEKELKERNIDYTVAIGEFEHSLNAIHLKVKIADGNDISQKERDERLEELQITVSQSSQELKNYENFKSNNEHYIEYHRLVNEQNGKVSDIEKDISHINSLFWNVSGLFKRRD